MVKIKSINFLIKLIINILLFFVFLYILTKFNIKKIQNNQLYLSNLIAENFFIIDSNNLETVRSNMYGFCVSKKGILTNNYYKDRGYNEEPESQGVYIFIKKFGNKLKLKQDYYGNFGLYSYENKDTGYFAISNSFLLLLENLIGKEKLTFNKDFADNLIISGLYVLSIYETLVKEIIKIQPNIQIIIDLKKKVLKNIKIKNDENTVPFGSKESLEIIDKWVDKWTYIIRSLKKNR